MKKKLTFIFCLVAINASAQIVELSNEVLSQYENKKQEEILSKPIDLESIIPTVDFSLGKIMKLNGIDPFGYYYAPYYIPNYTGYHIYIPNSFGDDYARYRGKNIISFNKNNDSIALLGYLPKGYYQIDGIIITDEECEELRKIVVNKLNTITDSKDIFTLEYRCRNKWHAVDSIQGLNRKLHNREKLTNTHRAKLILKGEDGSSFYLDVNENALSEAVLVEQYEYIKDYLLHNEWVLGEVGKQTTITTTKGLDYKFPDTVGVNIKELAIKDGKFIAIMKIGPDSIVDYNELRDWHVDSTMFGYTTSDNRAIYSEPIKYMACSLSMLDGTHRITRRIDYTLMKKAKNELRANGAAYEKIVQKRKKQEEVEIKNKQQKEKNILIANYGEKFGTLIFEHKVSYGMTKEMCSKAWGYPRNKIIRETSNGKQEVWLYGLANYLIFENGLLIESLTEN